MPFVPESLQLYEGGPDTPDDWVMTAPLSWTGTFRGQIGRLLIPESVLPFTTDLASVPRFLTWLVPRYGMYTKAAVLHDYLCRTIGDTVEVFPTRATAAESGAPPGRSDLIHLQDRSDADEVFRLTMTELGVPWVRRWLMWSAVSWATLWTSLWPGRSSKPALQWIGRAMLIVGTLAVGLLVWLGAIWFVGDAGWKWLRIVVLVVVGAAALAAALLSAGYVALGRWDRRLVYPVAYGMTIASLPLLAVGAVIALLLVFYLLFEDAFSGFRATRARVGRLFGMRPPAPRTAHEARIDAVRAS